MGILDRDDRNANREELIDKGLTTIKNENRPNDPDKFEPHSREKAREMLTELLMDNGYIKGLTDENLVDPSCTLSRIIPEIQECAIDQKSPDNHHLTASQHILTSVQNIDKNQENALELRLAMLLHDIGKPVVMQPKKDDPNECVFYGHDKKSGEMAQEILNRLGCSEDLTTLVTDLVKGHEIQTAQIDSKEKVNKLLAKHGEKNLRLMFKVRIADIDAQREEVRAERKQPIYEAEKLLDELVKDQKEKIIIAISGGDLAKRGFKGPEIRDELKRLEDLVRDGKLENSNEILLSALSK